MEMIERIKNMENIMDKSNKILTEMKEILKELEKNEVEFQTLKDYYYSEKWFEDENYTKENENTDNLKCGVLSQDSVYHLLSDYYETTIKMLEMATRMIKNF